MKKVPIKIGFLLESNTFITTTKKINLVQIIRLLFDDSKPFYFNSRLLKARLRAWTGGGVRLGFDGCWCFFEHEQFKAYHRNSSKFEKIFYL